MFNTLQYIVLPNGHVRVTRRSDISGKENTMDLPISEARLKEFANDGGKTLIQRLLPELTPSQREFLKTGMTDEDWDEACAEDASSDENLD